MTPMWHHLAVHSPDRTWGSHVSIQMRAVMTSRASLLQSHQPTTLLLSLSLPAVGHHKPGDISTHYVTLRSPWCLINTVIITITCNVVDVERVGNFTPHLFYSYSHTHYGTFLNKTVFHFHIFHITLSFFDLNLYSWSFLRTQTTKQHAKFHWSVKIFGNPPDCDSHLY